MLNELAASASPLPILGKTEVIRAEKPLIYAVVGKTVWK